MPQDILDVSFPVSVRGYDRRAVDAHIQRVNRVIAELKVSGSPPAAVRHALEQAEEKVQALLQAAREAAEEITASARQEAEASTTRAKAEAAELIVNTSAEADRVKAAADDLAAKARVEADDTVAKAKSAAENTLADARAEAENTLARAQAEADERRERLQEELAALQEQAEARRREIEADTEAVWKERGELLDDIRAMGSGLVDSATAAAARIRAPRAWAFTHSRLDRPIGCSLPDEGEHAEAITLAIAADETQAPALARNSRRRRPNRHRRGQARARLPEQARES